MRAIVTAPGLHLRGRSTQSGRIKDTLNYGDKLTLVGAPDKYNWQMVRVERTGNYGYVYSTFIAPLPDPVTESGPTNSPPAPTHAPPDVITEIRQPNPVLPESGRNHDVGTLIVTALIIAGTVAALYWTLR